MIYVRKDIPCQLLTKHVIPSDIECIFVELNFRKCKQLLVGMYYSPSQNFFDNLDKMADVYSHYKKVLLIEGFKPNDTGGGRGGREGKTAILLYNILVTHSIFFKFGEFF